MDLKRNEPGYVRWEMQPGIQVYRSVLDTQISALAMRCGTWNGHLNGTILYRFVCILTYGFLMPNVGQDFHVANGQRDFGLETNIETHLPSTLSLFWAWLHVRILWRTPAG